MRKLVVSENETVERTDRGGTYRVLITPGSVAAEKLIMGRATVPVGESVKPHAHDYSEETFFVLRGRGRLHLEGIGSYDFSNGDACLVPKGTVHTIENIGDEDVEVVFASAPLAPKPELGHRNMEAEQ
jgi:putative monooxygenase